MAFSLEDQSALFGVGLPLGELLIRLQAAQCFYDIRKDVEKSKLRLESLTPKNFKRASSLFRLNLQGALKDGPEAVRAKVLLPLLRDDDAPGSMDLFLFACLILTEDHCKKLEKTGLVSIFWRLFRGVVTAITAPRDTISCFATVIEEICGQVDSTSSQELLG